MGSYVALDVSLRSTSVHNAGRADEAFFGVFRP
jgi:hypothetical protein